MKFPQRPPLQCAPGALAALAALAALTSCASDGPAVYVHPNADLALYERIAVLPLENLTTDRFASERVREILVIEISAQGMFDVVEIGEVNRVLRVANMATVSDLGPEEVAALGEELEVQALFMGSVLEFAERRAGTITVPEVSLSLRLLDVETGLVVWSTTDARAGVGVWTRLFGWGEQSRSESTRQLVRELLATLY